MGISSLFFEGILHDIVIPEFIIASSTGKIVLLSENNSTGNASGPVSIADALINNPKHIPLNTDTLDWTNTDQKLSSSTPSAKSDAADKNEPRSSQIRGSNGDIHDASVSREEGLDSKPAPTNNNGSAPAIKMILEAQYDKITSMVSHPNSSLLFVGGHTGRN